MNLRTRLSFKLGRWATGLEVFQVASSQESSFGSYASNATEEYMVSSSVLELGLPIHKLPEYHLETGQLIPKSRTDTSNPQ